VYPVHSHKLHLRDEVHFILNFKVVKVISILYGQVMYTNS